MSGTEPVRWFAIDDWCSPRTDWTVPGSEWDGWEARYDNDCERGKRTTRTLPNWALAVMNRLHCSNTLRDCARRFGFWGLPDPTLHGGGLHVTSPGGSLACHLDYDRHPHIQGKRRAVNLIVFTHPRWEADWGGEFYLADPMGKPVVTLSPQPGRLVAFETNDLSYHGVLPMTGPAERVSIAAYLLTDATPANTRQRALFLPVR